MYALDGCVRPFCCCCNGVYSCRTPLRTQTAAAFGGSSLRWSAIHRMALIFILVFLNAARKWLLFQMKIINISWPIKAIVITAIEIKIKITMSLVWMCVLWRSLVRMEIETASVWDITHLIQRLFYEPLKIPHIFGFEQKWILNG